MDSKNAKSRVFILAAGEGSRWENYRGTQKHKLVIDGEVLIERTVKQFLKYTDDVVVVGNDKSYEVEGARCYIPPYHPRWLDMAKLYCTKNIWVEDRNVMVFGDVYFTDEAVKTIMTDNKEWRFYLRKEGSKLTGKPWREVFALAFEGSRNQVMKSDMESVIQRAIATKAGGWCLYRTLIAQYVGGDPFESDYYINIDDWTEDFDFPVDLDRWEEGRAIYKNT